MVQEWAVHDPNWWNYLQSLDISPSYTPPDALYMDGVPMEQIPMIDPPRTFNFEKRYSKVIDEREITIHGLFGSKLLSFGYQCIITAYDPNYDTGWLSSISLYVENWAAGLENPSFGISISFLKKNGLDLSFDESGISTSISYSDGYASYSIGISGNVVDLSISHGTTINLADGLDLTVSFSISGNPLLALPILATIMWGVPGPILVPAM